MRLKLVVVSLLLILTTGCSEGRNIFRYSMLDTSESRDFTQSLLTEVGISQSNIDLWLDHVVRYNTRMNDFVTRHSSGWSKTTFNAYFNIDFNETINNLNHEELDRDLNCRISVFTLLKDFLTNQTKGDITSELLEQEIKKMESSLSYNLTTEQEVMYRNIFATIQYNNTSELLNSISERSLTIKELGGSSNLGLIKIYVVNDGEAKVGHVAIILKREDNWFIMEKKNPIYPYQISEFSDFELIKYYYKNVYKNNKVIIMEDEKVIFQNV